MAEVARGLKLTVFRSAARTEDCTNGGITGRSDEVVLIGVMDEDGELSPLPDGSRKWEPSPDAPAVVLVKRPSLGAYLRPYDPDPVRMQRRPGAGGNYAAGDSRFTALLAPGFYGAVPVHDRFE